MRCLVVLAFLCCAPAAAAQSLTLLGVDSQTPAGASSTTTPSSCERFVDQLVARAEPPGWLPGPLRWPFQVKVGTQMVLEARGQMNGSARGRPVDGFRADLVANGQDGEVYRHILGHGGSMLLGSLGWWLSEREGRKDRKQQSAAGSGDDAGAQATAELAGDHAGREVGRAMEQRIHGHPTRAQLRQRLLAILSNAPKL